MDDHSAPYQIPLAIVGMGCRLPGADNLDQYWRLLIEGRQHELLEQLTEEMQEAAGAERYEHAAHLRDAIRTVETLRDRMQKIDTPSLGDRDAIGMKVGPAGAVIEIF